MAHKETRKIIREAKRQGWRVDEKGKHYKLFPPVGRMVTMAKTPSDVRALQNMIALMRQSGFKWKGR